MCREVLASPDRPEIGRIVQLVRTPLLHRGGRRFESYSAHRIAPEMGIFLFLRLVYMGWMREPQEHIQSLDRIFTLNQLVSGYENGLADRPR